MLIIPKFLLSSATSLFIRLFFFSAARLSFPLLVPRCCRKRYRLSLMGTQRLNFYHHPPFHDEAVSAAWLLPYITKVNSCSGSSICRIAFCVSRHFCVCGSGVCSQVYVLVSRPQQESEVGRFCGNNYQGLFFFLCFLIVVDFLSPPTMDQLNNKQLSSSSAALNSPERGETIRSNIAEERAEQTVP